MAQEIRKRTTRRPFLVDPCQPLTAVHAAECAGSEFLQKLCFVYPLNKVDRRSRTSACDNVGNLADQAEQRLEMCCDRDVIFSC
jgi:hypothetical protein